MDIFSRSWSLFKSSLRVVRSEPSLLWFPIASAITVVVASLLLFGVLGSLVAFNQDAQNALNAAVVAAESEDDSSLLSILSIAVLFVYYVVVGSIATYFTTAMTGTALRRLDGHDTSFMEGIQIANHRLGTILGYSAIVATVGVALSLLRRRRNGLAGALLAELGEMAWGIVTFLAVPVIADQKTNPINAIKESSLLLRKTWGEQLVGGGGIGAVFVLVGVGVLVLTSSLAALLSSIGDLALVVIGLGLIALVVVAVLNSTLGAIYKAAVYRYAAQGEVAPQFDAALIEHAFRLEGAPA